MLGLADIRDWIKTLDTGAENYYIGRLDAKKDKSIGVYSLNNTSAAAIALGGDETTKTAVKGVSILIHWNKNARETETAAFGVFEKMMFKSNFDIKDTHVNYVRLLSAEPIDVGNGADLVYERVIQAEFYYER
ncbi:hypothetical protein SAMN04515656_10343 [Eubacterium aggregans]|uniref:DUF3168 domain-containing protein n=1 Tax=Eubacterium aggregans TaxID=81409 RepID=A0A1H3Y590_9FIRM|nr:minor capsid protein [Eubacterium aggregans]SEA06008.1 hypothetical protein SAMN04515656_10343 [Eubacterium aggregans]